jgi:hypothetical protein
MEDGVVDLLSLSLSEPQDAGYEGLCKRCLTIPWRNLSNETPRVLLEINEPLEQWKSSYCRICRLVQSIANLGESTPFARLILEWSGFDYGTSYASHHSGLLDIRSGETDELRGVLAVTPYSSNDNKEQTQGNQWGYVDFELLRRCIQNCAINHESCNPQSQGSLDNLRVIDVCNRTIINAPKDCAYVALSYVWGQGQPENPSDTTESLSKLPLTIEDSIQATLRLGFRYLWIDRLVCSDYVLFRSS